MEMKRMQNQAKQVSNCCGGCFHGDCRVWMPGMTNKAIRDIRRGDRVLTGTGASAEVWCLTRFLSGNDDILVTSIPGTQLRTTPYHPIKLCANSPWTFPKDVVSSVQMPCRVVYNLVVTPGTHALMIEGVECAALGHGLTGDVVGHDFFGSNAVLQDLRRMPGWDEGLVDIHPDDIRRCPLTNKVSGIKP